MGELSSSMQLGFIIGPSSAGGFIVNGSSNKVNGFKIVFIAGLKRL